MTPSDTYEGNTYQGGATVGHVLAWAVGLSAEALAAYRRRRRHPGRLARDLDYDAAVAHLPLSDHPAYQTLHLLAWISHERRPLLASISPNTDYDKVTVPVLKISGWYASCWPALENYRGVRHTGTGLARHSRLVIGPWSHVDLSGRFLDRDFGPAAAGRRSTSTDSSCAGSTTGSRGRERRRHRGAGTDLRDGRRHWRSEPDWPLPDTRTPHYLHSDGQRTRRYGDGGLSITPPSGSRPTPS